MNAAADPRQIEALTTLIVRMAGLAEAQLAAANDALYRRDAVQGKKIHATDVQLDAYQRQIEALATASLLAKAPDAHALQEILGAIKIASELERVGDYAANIAKRIVSLADVHGLVRSGTLNRMGRLVQELLADVINAYSQRDLHRALDAWERDKDIDALYTSLYQEILGHMAQEPDNITGYTHLLFIAKNFERIGDHATNIAEMIHLLVAGAPMVKTRPKADHSPDIATHTLLQETVL